MTVHEYELAQGLTSKPVKGMLTGPVTILQWSFPRRDATRRQQAEQLALALRDEVADLQAAGCRVLQASAGARPPFFLAVSVSPQVVRRCSCRAGKGPGARKA